MKRSKFFFPASVFVVGVLYGFRSVWSFDLWWQMAEARWILEHGVFPITDHFTYPLQGTPYLAHEWGSGVVFYVLHSLAGAHALLLFQAAAFGLFGVASYYVFLQRERQPWAAWLFTILLLFVAKLRFPLRPELFTHFFVLALWALDGRRGRSAWLGYLLVFGLWSNFHGEFVFGLGFVFLSFAAIRTRDWGARAAASCAGILLNPYGWRVLSVPWYYLNNQEFIFRTSTEGQFVPLYFAIALSLAASSLGLLYWNRRRRRRPQIPWREAALILAFGAQTLKINRIFLLYAIVVMPILYTECMTLLRPRLKEPNRFLRRRLALAGALILVIFLSRWPLIARAWDRPMNPSSLPVKAVDFLETIGAQGRVFNSYSFGGYLSWRMHPRIRTFYDGRFNCTQLLHEENNARQSPQRWSLFLRRHDARFAVMDWVWEGGLNHLLGPKWKRGPRESPYEMMFPRRDWALIYWDDHALILARDIPENRALIRKYGLRLGDPLSLESTLEKVRAGEVAPQQFLSELDALRRRSGDNWIQSLMRRHLAARPGHEPGPH